MDNLRFRRATPSDIPALVALVTSAYRGEESRRGWTTEADLLDGPRIDPQVLQADIKRPRSTVIVAERDDGLLACVHVADEHGAGYLGMFSVRPDAQGNGVGSALMREAERHVREDLRLPIMRMTVIDVRDELIAYYERRGYARTGIKKPFPYGDARFGIPRREDLRFEVLEKRLTGAAA
ncbi:MAG TPA: GNAT family N-acetyltransferase [Pseudoxanthomonas sp.]|nr:GNAT family N-acetyltransferase [Pseudoxanthomonas sp.]